jgi:hypothetical protein
LTPKKIPLDADLKGRKRLKGLCLPGGYESPGFHVVADRAPVLHDHQDADDPGPEDRRRDRDPSCARLHTLFMVLTAFWTQSTTATTFIPIRVFGQRPPVPRCFDVSRVFVLFFLQTLGTLPLGPPHVQ